MSTIVFLEGPNGCGKDYFLEELVKLLKRDKVNYITLEAKKYLPENITNNRYTKVLIDEKHLQLYYYSHIRLLEDINILANHFDIILVNRSIISFLIYNLYFSDIKAQEKEYYEKEVLQLIEGYLKDQKTILINLIKDLTLEELKTRLETRDDRIVKIDYLSQINYYYHNLEEPFKKAFSFYQELSSNESTQFYYSQIQEKHSTF